MTYVNTIARPGALDRLAAAFAKWSEARRAERARREAYRRTANELSALTTRELDDLGIARSDIDRVALEAADLA